MRKYNQEPVATQYTIHILRDGCNLLGACWFTRFGYGNGRKIY